TNGTRAIAACGGAAAVYAGALTNAAALARHVVAAHPGQPVLRSEEHTSELQSRENRVCRLLPEKTKPTGGPHRASASRPRARRRGPACPASRPAAPVRSAAGPCRLRPAPRRSPLPYPTLLRSTNGTRAVAACGGAAAVYAGALTNAAALARHVVAAHPGQPVL